MASRNAAFSLLRRMALQDFVAVSAPMRSRSMAFPILRPLLRPRHYHATTPLRRVPGPKVAIPAPETSPLPFKTREPHSSVQPTVATQPSYEMTFTCKPCGVRSTHLVSKQGYHKGSVLITCPDCHNRHIISDHLKVGWSCATTSTR